MGGKGKKKAKNGAGAAEKKKGNKATKKSTGRNKSEGRRSKTARCNVDIFTDIAMENAYSSCHNVQDLLRFRGFPWPDAQKKKKKGKK